MGLAKQIGATYEKDRHCSHRAASTSLAFAQSNDNSISGKEMKDSPTTMGGRPPC
jgi:hypothetical protein